MLIHSAPYAVSVPPLLIGTLERNRKAKNSVATDCNMREDSIVSTLLEQKLTDIANLLDTDLIGMGIGKNIHI